MILQSGALLIVAALGFATPALAQGPSGPPQLRSSFSPGALDAPSGAAPDLAYGAFQRGFYLTAFREATDRLDKEPDPAAMVMIGEIYANGFGLPQDDARALSWFRLAADRGDRNAVFTLGMAHIDGRGGMAKDPALARPFFEQAAGLGHPQAAYNLGIMALSGQGVPVDSAAAARWFEAAAVLGSADAEYAFAVMLRQGDGVPRDAVRAASFMARAAAQNLPEALIEYGVMLFNGVGVERSEALAARQFRLAAERGNPVAMNRFARLLASGRGVGADSLRAARWHAMARLAGAEDPWLADFVSRLDPLLRDQAEREAAARFAGLR